MNMGSENDFLSGRFLGVNSQHQQVPGGFLGLNRHIQHPEPSSYPAVVPIDQMWPLMDMNSSIQSNRSVVARDCSMDLGGQKLFRPIPVMGNNHSLRINVNSSDEDDPSFDGEILGDASGAMVKKDKDGPWQRMKWTDKVVRLLIQVVSSVWEDGGVDGDGADGNGTRQKSGNFKKGKWKTVSSILISKGYQASPQQCEDKFNDLNKRYKKLNDILGRGVSCDVVQNPGLLEKMSHLSPKAKEVVKKLLSSKHLFYREMCAYHNGLHITPHCTGLVTQNPSRYSAEKNHSGDSLVKGSSKRDKDGSPTTAAAQCSKEKDVSEDEEEDSEDDDDDDASADDMCDDEADNNSECGIQGRVMENHHYAGHGKIGFSRRLENLQSDMAKIFNDPTKSKSEQKEWIRKRMLQLEEERIGIQAEALELGKRRVKWQRFCDKKESELEMARLEKERLLLENERKALQLKKTLDLEEKKFSRP